MAAVLGAASAHGIVESYRLLQHRQGWALAEVSGALTVEVGAAVALFAVVFAVPVLLGLKPRWLAGVAVVSLLAVQLAAWIVHPIPAFDLPPASSDPGPTVVLITTDTLRRDHVSAYPGAAADLTPNLRDIAAEGLRFDDAVSTAPLTLPSHASMLSGTLPSRHGVFRNGMVLPADLEGVPQDLARAGFHTGAFTSSLILHGSHGMRGWFHVYRDAIGTRIGADRLLFADAISDGIDWLRDAPMDQIGKEPGPLTVQRALTWLNEIPEDAPVFLWVHLYDAHAPYRDSTPDPVQRETVVPCDWSAHPSAVRRSPWHPVRPRKDPILPAYRCTEESWNKLVSQVAGYRGAVNFLDAQVGTLVEGLKAADRWDDAGVIVVADHGESLYEHQQHMTHQFSLYDPVIRVPLFIRAPGVSGVRTEPVSTVRIAATLRDLAGLEPDSGIAGPSLLQVGDDHPVAIGPAPIDRIPKLKGAAIQSVARWGGNKILVDEAGHVERYDLESDPGERLPGLKESEREAIRAIVQGRVAGAKPKHRLLLSGGGPPSLSTKSALQQAGVLGRPLSEEQAGAYNELEWSARDEIRELRARAAESDDADTLPDEIQKGLEALGYLQ